MANDMVTPAELAHLPGAPFTVEEVDAAVATLRVAAGWHIAPVRTEVGVALDVEWWEPTLRLPTRRLVSLDAVRNTDTGVVIDPTRYRVSHVRARARLKGGVWPAGYEAVEVDMTHGFDKLPADLLPVVAELVRGDRRDNAVRRVSVDDASVTYGGSEDYLSTSAALQRYVLPEWAGMA